MLEKANPEMLNDTQVLTLVYNKRIVPRTTIKTTKCNQNYKSSYRVGLIGPDLLTQEVRLIGLIPFN